MNKTHALVIAGLAVISVALDAVYGKALFTGFAVLVGAAGSVALMYGTRWLGMYVIKRPESWLGVDTPPDTHDDLAGGTVAIGEVTPHD
jgi:hypothetical protein